VQFAIQHTGFQFIPASSEAGMHDLAILRSIYEARNGMEPIASRKNLDEM